MHRALIVLAITLFPLTAMGNVPEGPLTNPLEICADLDADARSTLAKAHGLAVERRGWLKRL